MSKFRKKNNTCNCFIAFKKKNIYLKRVFTYSKPPINEPNYKIKNYYRTINQLLLQYSNLIRKLQINNI